MPIVYLLIAALLFTGLMMILSASFLHDTSFVGRRRINRLYNWKYGDQDLWDIAFFKTLVDVIAPYVLLDRMAEASLSKQLSRANLNITPKQFTARKYIIAIFAIILIGICALFQFWVGVICVFLLTVFLIMNERNSLVSKLRARDESIATEMPIFVRMVCRRLHNNRDILSILEDYHKVARPELKHELDILLTHMRTGDILHALQQFQSRLGTEEAFRLCSALIEIDRGIDQTATLDSLAKDMSLKAKLNIQKALASRPLKLRTTYIPAVLICVVIIIYVLVVFMMDMLNNML